MTVRCDPVLKMLVNNTSEFIITRSRSEKEQYAVDFIQCTFKLANPILAPLVGFPGPTH